MRRQHCTHPRALAFLGQTSASHAIGEQLSFHFACGEHDVARIGSEDRFEHELCSHAKDCEGNVCSRLPVFLSP